MLKEIPSKKGEAAEEKACNYLIKHGLKPVARNYFCRMGEIDLIMRDGTCLVFVEVRARTSAAFGGAGASVTFQKQQKIIKTALHFLMKNKWQDKHPLRFDVISMDGRSAKINWIKNAFGAN